MTFLFEPNDVSQSLRVRITDARPGEWISNIKLVYCTDQECTPGISTVLEKRIAINPNTLTFDIPVPSASAYIVIRELSFARSASGRQDTLLTMTSPEGVRKKFSHVAVFSPTLAPLEDTKDTSWWVLILIYTILYLVLAITLGIAYQNWRMLVWPYFCLKAILA